MKQLLSFCICLCCISVSLSQNWDTVSGLTGFDNQQTHLDIFFLDDNTGWISRNDGAIQKTTDGGITWSTQITGLGQVRSIFFIDATHGWAVGGLNTHYTTDGGGSWTTVQAGSTPGSESLLSVFFISQTHGWASGYNYIYRTTDGGLSWSKVLPTGGIFNDIFFTSETVGYCVGSINYILKSTDGGVSWSQLSAGTPSTTHTGVQFVDANTGYVCGQDGVIKKTTDAGVTWTSMIAQNSSTPDLNDIFFVDANTGWVVGNSRTIKSTTDGGATWNDENTLLAPSSRSYRAVHFTNATKGLALAYDNLESYSVALPPVLTQFSPTSGTFGDQVVITGDHFNGTIEVTIGGVTVQDFTVDSENQITATVGAGSSGDVSVTTFGGSATSSGFTYVNQVPSIDPIADVSFCNPLDSYQVSITTSDVETAPASLIVSASSNNQALVMDANITVDGASNTKTLTVVPENGASGTVEITVLVTDEDGDDANVSFQLTVGGDLTNPTIVYQDITVDLDVNGTATILAEDMDNGSTDNCSSSPSGGNPIYLSAGGMNRLWSYVPGVDSNPQEIAVDWSEVGDYGGIVYFGNYGGLEVNELTGQMYVAGGFGDKNYVMQTPIDESGPMERLVGQTSGSTTYDFEYDSANQVVYMATSQGLFKQALNDNTPSLLASGNVKSVTLDTTNDILYFITDSGVSSVATDGTGLDENYLSVDGPYAITMDVASGRLFWTEPALNAIYTALADGSETPSALYTNNSPSGDHTAIDYSPQTGELYYAVTSGTYYALEDYVFKVSADGLGTPEEIAQGDFGGVTGIATGKNYTPRPPLSFSVDISDFDCSNLGDNQVTLTVTDDAGNSSNQVVTVTITDTNDFCNALSVNELDIEASISIIPSIVKEDISIENSSRLSINTVGIYDLNGRRVHQLKIGSASFNVNIDASGLAPGVYLANIATEKGSVIKKFVKQ